MARSITMQQRIEFGDCDPAGIVWFPNYHRWLDAASRNYFIKCGLPPWRQTVVERGIVGTPIVSCNASFVCTASYDDVLTIETCIKEWRRKSFVQRHSVSRTTPGGDVQLVMRADEIRVFAMNDGERLRAIEVPADYIELCS
ncbi:acyl-CoA thioesterase [Burkholderia cenocepacia]|uniref:4-hydroxybenzoyl-CoA thioesterase n=2 Tax=Pseudomonadota TaxID=1224 RepID=4HBT_PSEUC|nr:RecName: Full=4-hydroxybenzoyl-CoA thioesterase [Pseudomonas sp. CBS3]pir/C42560/ 4-chlorobenzoate dehalogenase (EC 3.8.1.6), 16K chain - Pseudomonas sp. (strain CBS-3) [Pseudomonas sp.]MDR5644433.1 acyl-CoA thioesterase [Burkholderia cenocepacia]